MPENLAVWIGAAALLAAACVRAWLRHAPLRLRLPEKPQSAGGRQFGAEFDHDSSLGKAGELITGLMLAARGWRQLPSQPTGVHALDGLFVRRRLWGYAVMAVETKCSRDGDPKANYKPAQMTDDAVIRQIERLADDSLAFQGQPYLAEPAARRLMRAVRRGAVRKRFASHQLGVGTSLLYRVHRDGTLGRVVLAVRDERHRFMLQALAIGLSRLDAAAPYGVSGVAMRSPLPKAASPFRFPADDDEDDGLAARHAAGRQPMWPSAR